MMIFIFLILEVQNRCIMAGLPFLFGEKRKGAQLPASAFWKRAKVVKKK